jgi:uncharacterized protein YbjQ (UPF0145 family)
MKKIIILSMMVLIIVLAGCASNNYTASLTGAADNSTIAVKDFVTLGIITVRSTEIHKCGPFGISRSVQGSKITFADLMQEAAKLESDDIINVRIDINTSYSKTAFDWLTGWTRTYSYTGTALAIKYTEKVDIEVADPQLSSLPKTPETSGAVKVTKSGKVVLR